MKKIFFFVVLSFSLLPFQTHAKSEKVIPLLPKNTPLHSPALGSIDSMLRFKGELVVSGKLIASMRSVVDASPKDEKQLELNLMLDEAELSKLPRLAYGDKTNVYSPDSSIGITNSQHSLEALFAREDVQNLKSGKVSSLELKGKFRLGQYEAYIECDHLYNNAQIKDKKIKGYEYRHASKC